MVLRKSIVVFCAFLCLISASCLEVAKGITDWTQIENTEAILKIENKKLKQQAFQHAYFISSNKKTVLINLMELFEVYFDPFIEKMIL